MNLHDRITAAGDRVTGAGTAARDALGVRLPGAPDLARVQAWLAETPMPAAPASATWTLSIGALLGRLGSLPASATTALGVLDRFGRVSVGPDSLGLDGDDLRWSEITEVRTAPVATVLSQDVVARELERIRHLLPPIPGRAAVLAQLEAVLGVLLARALASAGGDVVYAIDTEGRRGRPRTVTVGAAAALALVALPAVDRSIRATAERNGVRVREQQSGRHEVGVAPVAGEREVAERRAEPPPPVEGAAGTPWNLPSGGESPFLRPTRPPDPLSARGAPPRATVPAPRGTEERGLPATAAPADHTPVPASAADGAHGRRAPLGLYGRAAVGCFAVAAMAAVGLIITTSSDDSTSPAATGVPVPTAVGAGTGGGAGSLPPPSAQGGAEVPGAGSATTAPAPSEVVAGDLGLSVPISSPTCDSTWLVFLGAATDPSGYGADVSTLLSSYPSAEYTLTRGGCSSMRQQLPDGSLIYAVYIGPYPDQESACSARAAVGGNAYVKRMDNATPPEQTWQC